MKKTIALALALCFASLTHAQQATAAPVPNQPAKPSRPTPEQIATRQSMHLQKMLELNDDQKQKVYQAVLTRTTAVQKTHEKFGPDGDKKAMHAEIKPVKVQFVQTMSGILTPAQKTKWDEHRMKMKKAHDNRKKDGAAAPATEKAQKPASDDDGIDD